ncbi:MAG: peptidylprolyl isomerase [Rhodospirillales bacterium]
MGAIRHWGIVLGVVVLALLTAMTATSSSRAASSAGDQAIVAVVNDDVISKRDLEARINLVVATGNMENQPDVRQKIAPEVLRLLIDDRLKQQEARRVNVTVSQRELDRALTDISRQLNVEPARLPDYLQARGATMTALLAQVETEIAWIKTITKITGDRTAVSEEEVEEEMARLRGTAGGLEYRVTEVFLPVDDSANEVQVQELADRIVREARGGASFAALARTFSQSASAESGGDLGWIRAGQLDGRLDQVVQQLNPGDVSAPIRTETGIYILQLANRRTASALDTGVTILTLHQVVLPLSPQAPPATVAEQLGKANQLRANPGTCAEFSSRGRELGAVSAGDLGRVDLDKLPPPIRQIVSPLKGGQVSEPVRTGDGIMLLMVCDRQEQALSPDVRAQVERRIFEQRMSAAARQHLRDLRRSALLDIRM